MVLKSIKTGFFLYDGGVLFGVAPKVAWSAVYPADENNFCQLTMRSLLIQTDGKVVLIDTGVGTKNADIMEEIGFSGLQTWDELLHPYNLTPADVTDVVLTSLHFEHCGGCTYFDYDMNLNLTFPNATVHVAEEQWKSLLNPSERERCMFIPADVMEIFKKEKLHVIKDGETFTVCNGVELHQVTANTNNMLVAYINDGNRDYVFASDVIPTAGNLSLDWLDAHDLYPVQAQDVKDKLLKHAVAENLWVIFPKDNRFDCAKVIKNEDYEVAETLNL